MNKTPRLNNREAQKTKVCINIPKGKQFSSSQGPLCMQCDAGVSSVSQAGMEPQGTAWTSAWEHIQRRVEQRPESLLQHSRALHRHRCSSGAAWQMPGYLWLISLQSPAPLAMICSNFCLAERVADRRRGSGSASRNLKSL